METVGNAGLNWASLEPYVRLSDRCFMFLADLLVEMTDAASREFSAANIIARRFGRHILAKLSWLRGTHRDTIRSGWVSYSGQSVPDHVLSISESYSC